MAGVTVERLEVSSAHGSGPEGGNSTWVLPDAGIVVDPGPPDDAAWHVLETGLEDVGLPVGDVTDVVVTHWHVDHAGLAPRLAEAAEATLHMHDADAPFVRSYATERERRLDRDAETLARWGVPAERIDPLVDADTPSAMPDGTGVASVTDGDSVGPLVVRHTPGHTAGHVALLLDEDADDAPESAECRGMVGDALLRTITPNVGGGDTRQRQPLGDYRRTLDVLEQTVDRALPGHGTPFAVAPRVAELREHHRDRAGLVLDSLEALDPTIGTDDAVAAGESPTDASPGVTPWGIAVDRFGEMEGFHVKFGAGEAYAHLTDLVDLGLADRVATDPLRYRRAAQAAADSTRLEIFDSVWLETDT